MDIKANEHISVSFCSKKFILNVHAKFVKSLKFILRNEVLNLSCIYISVSVLPFFEKTLFFNDFDIHKYSVTFLTNFVVLGLDLEFCYFRVDAIFREYLTR